MYIVLVSKLLDLYKDKGDHESFILSKNDEITFETKPYNAIFKTSITPTDEETIDNEISYSYGQTNDKKYGNVLYLTKGNCTK